VIAFLLEEEVLRLDTSVLNSPPPSPLQDDGTAWGYLRSWLAVRPFPGPGLGLGLSGAAAGGALELVQAWRVLYERKATLVWFLCFLLHYFCMVSRWCGWCAWTQQEYPVPAYSTPLRPRSPARLAAAASPPRSGTRSPVPGAREEKDFWPPALGLAPLLLAAACERAPLAWPLDRATADSSSSLSAASSEATRPLRVEDFDTVRLIGSGEFGKVYQVKQRSTQEVFAMKRLSKEFYSRRRMADKAIREIATLHLARDHPFVVRLMYTIENAREWALVMEYCPHGDLQQLLLAEGCPGLPMSRTLRISAEVALALEHLHARGIVFRDLKLENVVLDKDGHAKLTDFGLAKQHRGGRDAITEAEQAGDVYCSFTKTFCGSYGYAAPEVNPRRQVHGFAADMYSYGVLLLMLLMGGEVYHDTRQPPWERRLPPETPRDLLHMISHLSFEFYWGSHHFLLPARSTHRVEVNLNGSVVLVSRGPRAPRRQERPPRPPNSPRTPRGQPVGPDLSELTAGAVSSTRSAPSDNSWPAQFPALACQSCEAAQRRWDLALDLVGVLTNEFPERRGTVARVKQHPFFAEEIADWRTVYPKSWLLERVRAKLLVLFGWTSLPQHWEQQLQRLTSEELASLQDEPAAYIELLEQASSAAAQSQAQASSPSISPSGALAAEPSAGVEGEAQELMRQSSSSASASASASAGVGPSRASHARSGSSGGAVRRAASDDWVAHYA